MLWAVAPVVALPYTLATPGAAAALMLGYGVSHLPVVDEEGKALWWVQCFMIYDCRGTACASKHVGLICNSS